MPLVDRPFAAVMALWICSDAPLIAWVAHSPSPYARASTRFPAPAASGSLGQRPG